MGLPNTGLEDATSGTQRYPWIENALWVLAVVGVLVLPGVGGGMAWGQVGGGGITVQSRPIEAPRVDSSHAMAAFHQVSDWVLAGREPAAVKGNAIPVTGLAGVRVTLRWGGAVVGRGDVMVGDDATVARLLDVCHDATAAALREARDYIERFDSRQREADGAAATQPALMMEALTGQFQVDLQLALAMEPIRLRPGEKPEAILSRFAPMYHGLRFRRTVANGQVMEHWIWPGSAVAANTSPGSQVVQSLSRLEYSVNDPAKARAIFTGADAPRVDRFMVIHLVRSPGREGVTRLVRGHAVKPLSPFDEKGLDSLTRRVAVHLSQRVNEMGEVANEFRPSSDVWADGVASDSEMALTAMALARWSRVDKTDPDAVVAGRAAQRIVAAIVARRQAISAPTAGLMLLTIPDLPEPGRIQELRDKLVTSILARRNEDGSFVAAGVAATQPTTRPDDDAADAPDALAPPEAQPARATLGATETAIVLCALARLCELSQDGEVAVVVAQSQARLWRGVNQETVVSLIPWIAMTEASLDRAPQTEALRAARYDAAGEIHRLVTAMRDLQITQPPDHGPADVVGGFELRHVPVDAPPAPDWRSAQVLALLAVAMRDARAVPEADRMATLLASGLAVRYMDQLTFDEEGGFFVRSFGEVKGGVRLSLWDNRLTLSPSAMTLLSLTELRVSLNAMSRQGDAAGGK